MTEPEFRPTTIPTKDTTMATDTENKGRGSGIDYADRLSAAMADGNTSEAMNQYLQWLMSEGEDWPMRGLYLRQLAEACLYRIDKMCEHRRLSEITDLAISLERGWHKSNNPFGLPGSDKPVFDENPQRFG